MTDPSEIVVTGLGVVCPIGIGIEAYWQSLRHGTSGVGPYDLLQGTEMPVQFGGVIKDFDPKQYVKPRKSLKVMCKVIQEGFAAATLAVEHAGIEDGAIAPDRFGVVFGSEMLYGPVDELSDVYERCKVDGEIDTEQWSAQAMSNIYPLWMLKYLPNMAACHIGIAHDARGPNNSITHGDVSSLLAMIEAVHKIRRGQADVMIAGGAGARLDLTQLLYRGDSNLSHRHDDPAAASRPFDADRDGMVNGEGSGAIVFESREHAERRGANILATLRGVATSYEPRMTSAPITGDAIRRTITQSLADAGLDACDIGHVNAHGVATVHEDPVEAQAIHDCLGDVPVTAIKSYFGNLGVGSGAVEAVASVLALLENEVPRTLNYETPDSACPVNVVHDDALVDAKPIAMVLSQAGPGQAASIVLSRD